MSKKRTLLRSHCIELSSWKYSSGFIWNFLKYHRCLIILENYLPIVKSRGIGRRNVTDLIVTSSFRKCCILKTIGLHLKLPTDTYNYQSTPLPKAVVLFQKFLADTYKYLPIFMTIGRQFWITFCQLSALQLPIDSYNCRQIAVNVGQKLSSFPLIFTNIS